MKLSAEALPLLFACPPQGIGKTTLAVAVTSTQWNFPLDVGVRDHLGSRKLVGCCVSQMPNPKPQTSHPKP